MRISSLAACLLLCLLLAGATAAVEPAPEPAIEPASPDGEAASSYHRLFLELGLPHADESAEAVLLRAHGGDTRAMALAVAGYELGAGGFPKDRRLALSWAMTVEDWGAPRMSFFLRAFCQRDRPPVADPQGLLVAECEAGRKSSLAAPFRQAGLFDIEALASTLALLREQWSGEDQRTYREFMDDGAAFGRDTAAFVAKLRGFTTGEADEESLKGLRRWGEDSYSRRWLFFMATTHDPESQGPDWNDDRLLDFVRLHRRHELGASELALRSITARLLFDSSPVLETARKAHAGDIPAMRSMVGIYAGGETGVAGAHLVRRGWLERAATMGDAISMLALAYELLDSPFPVTRADGAEWAARAAKHGDAEVRARAERVVEGLGRGE